MGKNPAPPPSDDAYAALAPLYDAWQTLDGSTPFWRLVLGQLEPALARWGRTLPVTSFLDLGCGTGELLLGLAARHPDWRLTGVDACEPMLAMARGKPGAGRVSWLQGDLRVLDDAAATDPTLTGFAAAGAFYDTINHLPDPAALVQLFGALSRRVLIPGGLFIFDVTNAVGFQKWWSGSRTWRGPDWEIRTSLSYDPTPTEDSGTASASVTISHDASTTHLALTQRCFSEAVIRNGVAAAGMRVELATAWSPFEIDAPGKTLWIVSN